MSFETEVLLHLKREYSKDETVALLNKKIKELEYENGILKSEKAELIFIKDNIKLSQEEKYKIRLDKTIKRFENMIRELQKPLNEEYTNSPKCKQNLSHIENLNSEINKLRIKNEKMFQQLIKLQNS